MANFFEAPDAFIPKDPATFNEPVTPPEYTRTLLEQMEENEPFPLITGSEPPEEVLMEERPDDIKEVNQNEALKRLSDNIDSYIQMWLTKQTFTDVTTPFYMKATDHEFSHLTYISVKKEEGFTILMDNPHEISQIYLSQDENCRRVSIRTDIKNRTSTWIYVKLVGILDEDTIFYICTVPEVEFSYQRTVKYDASSKESTRATLVTIYMACICLSCLFSGLNLALLSLDVETLEMIKNYDEDLKMRRYAEDIIPIRRDSNLMICTIIIGNTLCNVASTIIFGMLTEELNLPSWQHALLIVFVPTAILLIFGDIMPQIICTKFALTIGAHLKMVMQFFTFITFPLSKPLSWTLDFFIGTETLKSSAVREIARFAVRKDKMAMIANNTLALRKKLAKDVMTPLSQVKMLSDGDIVNNNLRNALKMGHTRMPVCRGGDPTNIVGVLNVKDLLLLDDSDFITVGTVLQLWQRESTCRFVPGETPVPQLMPTLRNKATLVIVTEFLHSEMRNVPTGIVTLEDLLEEIVGEIYDEKDRQKMAGNEKDGKMDKKLKNNLLRKREKREDMRRLTIRNYNKNLTCLAKQRPC